MLASAGTRRPLAPLAAVTAAAFACSSPEAH